MRAAFDFDGARGLVTGGTSGIGAAEALRIQAGWANPYEKMENVQSLKPDYYPGDLGFDPLGLKPTDPEESKVIQTQEPQKGPHRHGSVGKVSNFHSYSKKPV